MKLLHRLVALALLLAPMPALAQSAPAPTTNLSGTITVGGTFQVLDSARYGRRSFEFQNKCKDSGACVSTTDNCYVWFFDTSASPTLLTAETIYPGQSYLRSSGTTPAGQIQVTCDGTGDVFYAAVQ